MLVAAWRWQTSRPLRNPRPRQRRKLRRTTLLRSRPQTETTAKVAEDAATETQAVQAARGYTAEAHQRRQVWCTKTVILGSQIPVKEDCRDEAQLREIIRSNRATMREELEQGSGPAAAVGCTIN